MAKSEKSRTGRSVLIIVAVLLFASGVVRVSTGTGQAVADELESRFTQAKLAPDGVGATLGMPVGELVETLLDREARVEDRESQLDLRLEALARVEARVQQQLEVLKTAEAALAETIAQARGAAQGDVERLTALYENMKPKDAIPIFEQMDSTFAAGFLGRMRSDAAAGIMSGLTPEKAYAISVILAGRNASLSDG